MKDPSDFNAQVKAIQRLMVLIFLLMAVAGISVVVLLYNPDLMLRPADQPEVEEYVVIPEDDEFDKIENGIHLRTGLVEAEGLMEVVNNCTNCHSALLITQNRMNEERWVATIRWMQETQNLWDLGKNEEIIVNYLVENYPPVKKGRRANLQNIEWYELED